MATPAASARPPEQLPLRAVELDERFAVYEAGAAPGAGPAAATPTVLVMGASGVGKTSLLQSLANEALGVQFDDPAGRRVSLVSEETRLSQAHSQTQRVTAYLLEAPAHPRVGGLRLVDTPGVCDTGGPERDAANRAALARFLRSGHAGGGIHAVVVVVKSSEARWGEVLRERVEQVLGMLGRDMLRNVVFAVTFCDGLAGPSAAEETLRERLGEAFAGGGDAVMRFVRFNNNVRFLPSGDPDVAAAERVLWERNRRAHAELVELAVGLDPAPVEAMLRVLEGPAQLRDAAATVALARAAARAEAARLGDAERVRGEQEAIAESTRNHTTHVTVTRHREVHRSKKKLGIIKKRWVELHPYQATEVRVNQPQKQQHDAAAARAAAAGRDAEVARKSLAEAQAHVAAAVGVMRAVVAEVAATSALGDAAVDGAGLPEADVVPAIRSHPENDAAAAVLVATPAA